MRKGFTLVELLVTIAILAALAALLIPILSQTRGQAHKATCESNLRSLSQSIRLYIEDYDGTWPTVNAWAKWNSQKNLPGCPMAKPPVSAKYRHDWVLGYAYNTELSSQNLRIEPNGNRKISPAHDKQIIFPTTTVAFCEANTEQNGTQGPDPNKGQVPYPYQLEKGWERHNGGSNYLFCDGHVKWHRMEDVRSALPAGINDGTHPSFAIESVGSPQ